MHKEYLDFARDELTEHLLYLGLAKHEKNKENRALLEQLAAQEERHYEFWKSLIKETVIRPYAITLYTTLFLRLLLGVTFITKFFERQEQTAIQQYEEARRVIPEQYRARLGEIIEEEKHHEQSLIENLQERRVAYVGFIALGLADAIVEITGVHAGFLGVTGSTLIAGVSGVIVGTSAAISMGSAAYIQAKQEPEKSAYISGVTTGVSYLGSVILLAGPYFFIHTMFSAFSLSTLIGILLLAGFTFYGAVVFNRKFIHEFGEATSLMLATALITFILGNVIGGVFHLTASTF